MGRRLPPTGRRAERPYSERDAAPKNARRLKVQAQREAQRIQRARAAKYGDRGARTSST